MVFSMFTVNYALMLNQTRFVRVGFGTVVAAVFISSVVMLYNQVVVQSIERKGIILKTGHKRQSIILMIRSGVSVGDYLCEFRQV